jgi:hypothetical protein
MVAETLKSIEWTVTLDSGDEFRDEFLSPPTARCVRRAGRQEMARFVGGCAEIQCL